MVDGAYVTAPPFRTETIIMTATGWDYPTLCATPTRIVEEVMIYLNTRTKCQNEKAKAAAK